MGLGWDPKEGEKEGVGCRGCVGRFPTRVGEGRSRNSDGDKSDDSRGRGRGEVTPVSALWGNESGDVIEVTRGIQKVCFKFGWVVLCDESEVGLGG